jgi:hypothetical protein
MDFLTEFEYLYTNIDTNYNLIKNYSFKTLINTPDESTYIECSKKHIELLMVAIAECVHVLSTVPANTVDLQVRVHTFITFLNTLLDENFVYEENKLFIVQQVYKKLSFTFKYVQVDTEVLLTLSKLIVREWTHALSNYFEQLTTFKNNTMSPKKNIPHCVKITYIRNFTTLCIDILDFLTGKSEWCEKLNHCPNGFFWLTIGMNTEVLNDLSQIIQNSIDVIPQCFNHSQVQSTCIYYKTMANSIDTNKEQDTWIGYTIKNMLERKPTRIVYI